MRTGYSRWMTGLGALLLTGALVLLGGTPVARAAATSSTATAITEMQGDSASCTMNSQCPAGDFCSKATGDCSGSGTCAVKPQVCSKLIDYVCGCDGNTYGNPCYAMRAGVSVAHNGRC